MPTGKLSTKRYVDYTKPENHRTSHRKHVSGQNYMVYCTCGLRMGAHTMSEVRGIKNSHLVTVNIMASWWRAY